MSDLAFWLAFAAIFVSGLVLGWVISEVSRKPSKKGSIPMSDIPRSYAVCVMAGCQRAPWGATHEDLMNLLNNQGWYDTPYGWVCPRHAREHLALSSLTDPAPPAKPAEITDEMVERAASAMWDRWGHPGMFPHAPVHRQNSFRTDARAALEAALSTERGE